VRNIPSLYTRTDVSLSYVKQQRMNCIVCYSPILQSFIVTAEPHSQGTRRETSSEHGSVLRILLLIIWLRARPTTMEPQGGSCGVEHSKSGRKTDPYSGSVAIVRFLPLSLLLSLIESLAVFSAGSGKTVLWCAVSRLSLMTGSSSYHKVRPSSRISSKCRNPVRP